MYCSDIPNIMLNETSNVPLVFIDTAGCGFTELDLPHEMSKGNESESLFIYTLWQFRFTIPYYNI